MNPKVRVARHIATVSKAILLFFSPNSAMTGDTFDTRHDDDVG